MNMLETLKKSCPVIPDDHLLISETFLSEFQRQFTPRGVIHIGAHHGQEVELYRRAGFKKILLIEANPALAENLRTRFADAPDITVLHAAATDSDATVELLIHTSRSGSNEPASLLELKEFKRIVPTLHTPERTSVPGIRLDTFFQKGPAVVADYNFMVLDIQGAELMALRGARRTVAAMDAVQAEAGIVEMYEGGALYSEIQSFLSQLGLPLHKGVLHELYDEKGRFPAWGEFYFANPSSDSP
jgi:FkbM family methyltransferase